MRTPRIAAVATLLALSLLTACGGDGDDDSDSSDDKTTVTVTETPSDATSAPTEATPTTDASVTPMDPTEGDVTQDQGEAALLTPEEVSPDFVLGSYSYESSPFPCDPDGTPVDEAVPPSVQGGTGSSMPTSGRPPGGDRDLRDGGRGRRGVRARHRGPRLCRGFRGRRAGHDQWAPGRDGPGQQCQRIGTSTPWEFSTGRSNGVFVATLAGRIILATQFSAAPDVDTSAFPAPIDVATAAFGKALAN